LDIPDVVKAYICVLIYLRVHLEVISTYTRGRVEAPHFGGLWEAAARSTKRHLKRIVSDVKLTFEEMSTALAQIETVLNSHPLAPLPGPDEALEPLTPGHFLIGPSLESLLDPSTFFNCCTGGISARI
jgi:hypothetical protein